MGSPPLPAAVGGAEVVAVNVPAKYVCASCAGSVDSSAAALETTSGISAVTRLSSSWIADDDPRRPSAGGRRRARVGSECTDNAKAARFACRWPTARNSAASATADDQWWCSRCNPRGGEEEDELPAVWLAAKAAVLLVVVAKGFARCLPTSFQAASAKRGDVAQLTAAAVRS